MGVRFTNEALLEALRELAEKLGRVPTTYDMDCYYRETGKGAGHTTYYGHFRNWAEALTAAGLGTPRSARYYPDEKLCEILRAFAKELGHTPLRKDVDARKGTMPCSQTYIARFGTWKGAIAAAGLKHDYHYRRNLSDEDLIGALHLLADKLGHTPTVRELSEMNEMPCHATYSKRFGSWKKALALAGLKKTPLKTKRAYSPNVEMARKFKQTRILGQLKRFVKHYKCMPSPDKIGKKTQTPCYRTCVSYFGSWQATLSALAEIL